VFILNASRRLFSDRFFTSSFRRVLFRAIPELEPELRHVASVFDPWARERGDYYALDWKPRAGAERDEAFR
jgi:hypothetical protein